ncbi:MAG: HlyD family efflux transporter periplasmic adaptor subunit [Gammaproteobacteria bacterium]|nr:HlyD family efflux transporter periplasmic adaptor subunit [Gammaproteobacteria bacterium]
MKPIYLLLSLTALLLTGCGSNADNGYAVGILEWDRIEVAAQVAEPVIAWEAQEGSLVTAGQLLLRLDDSHLQARANTAEAARAQAAARLAELERGTRPERIAQAQAQLTGSEQTLQFQQRELTRLNALLERKLTAPDQVDAARNAVNTARATRDSARATLDELQHGATIEERDQARQALAAAEAEAQAAQLDLGYAKITAPVAGRLDELPFKVGERPTVGSVVAVILAGSHPYARVYVPEAVRVQIHPGSTASVNIDGIDSAFTGTVRKVAADASFTPYYALTEHDRGRLSFVAEVDIDAGDRVLPAGVPVQVQFELAATHE